MLVKLSKLNTNVVIPRFFYVWKDYYINSNQIKGDSVRLCTKTVYDSSMSKIDQSVPVSKAVEVMISEQRGALAVTKSSSGDVVGIITERDCLKCILIDKSCAHTTVGEVCITERKWRHTL